MCRWRSSWVTVIPLCDVFIGWSRWLPSLRPIVILSCLLGWQAMNNGGQSLWETEAFWEESIPSCCSSAPFSTSSSSFFLVLDFILFFSFLQAQAAQLRCSSMENPIVCCLSGPICIVALNHTLNLQTLFAQLLGLLINEVRQLKSQFILLLFLLLLLFFLNKYPLLSLEFG